MSEVMNWVRSLRPDFREREGATCFGATPLFVVLGPLIDASLLIEIFNEIAESDELDSEDDDQTSRLETRILDQVDATYREMLCIDWVDDERPETSSLSIVVVETTENSFLCLYDFDTIPSFQVVAMGDDESLYRAVAMHSELTLPRVGNGELRHVQAPALLPWTEGEVSGIVKALLGT